MEHSNYILTKNDFKVLRTLLSIALEREFVQGLEQATATVKAWKTEQPESGREYYHQLFSDLKAHRKALAHTYDGLSKDTTEYSVIGLYRRGVLTAADLADIKPQLKAYLVWRARD